MHYLNITSARRRIGHQDCPILVRIAVQQQVIADQLAKRLSQVQAAARAESPEFNDTPSTGQSARWAQSRDHLHKAIGDGLNNALQDLEHPTESEPLPPGYSAAQT
jgi:hypothetical protein